MQYERRIKLEELQILSQRKKWIHDLDMDIINDEKEKQAMLDNGIDKTD